MTVSRITILKLLTLILLKSAFTDICVLLIVTSLGCLCFTMQNDECYTMIFHSNQHLTYMQSLALEDCFHIQLENRESFSVLTFNGTLPDRYYYLKKRFFICVLTCLEIKEKRDSAATFVCVPGQYRNLAIF